MAMAISSLVTPSFSRFTSIPGSFSSGRSLCLSRFETSSVQGTSLSSTVCSKPNRARHVPHATASNVKPLKASEKQPQSAASGDPLRSFPWDLALERFAARLFDLVWTALKWLTVPTLLLSSTSEFSYAMVHGKLLFIPFAMFVGVVLAGVMSETALEVSPRLRKGFPWHLLALGLMFSLIKLPGPSYPFWGRIILPHFANGGLWQTCYLVWQGRKA